jgi:hypothetical protein
MRDFNEADKKKKQKRINVPANPGNLSPEALAELENVVKGSLKDGYLPCPAAWVLADEAKVPRIVIGSIADGLGVRVVKCQLGCFGVAKTPGKKTDYEALESGVVAAIEGLEADDQLTCAAVFDLAKTHKLNPMVIADEISAMGLKVHICQLGCF